jgi:hypothetical protein
LVLSLITMAEDDISMNELEAAIQGLNATLKRFMEAEEVRHNEYLRSRSAEVSRMDRIEEQLVVLQMGSASNGGLNSFTESPTNQPFQRGTTMTDLLQEEIDASESSTQIDASELISESLPMSDEIHPSLKSIEKHSDTDESICAESLVVDAVTPTSDFHIKIATCLKESITSNDQIELPSVLEKSSIVVAVRLFAEPNQATMISMLNDELMELLSSPDALTEGQCCSHGCLLPPPPKPSDRSFRQMKVDFHMTLDRSMSPPPPEPPDINHIVVST